MYRATKLRLNKHYINTIVWANFILMGLVPFIILLYLNVSVLKKLMERRTWLKISNHKNLRTLIQYNIQKSNALIKRRFVNDHNTRKNRRNETIEITPMGDIETMIPEGKDDKHREENHIHKYKENNEKLSVDFATDDHNVSSEDNISSQNCSLRIHTYTHEYAGRTVVRKAWVNLAIFAAFMIFHSIKWVANFYEMIMVRYLSCK